MATSSQLRDGSERTSPITARLSFAAPNLSQHRITQLNQRIFYRKVVRGAHRFVHHVYCKEDHHALPKSYERSRCSRDRRDIEACGRAVNRRIQRHGSTGSPRTGGSSWLGKLIANGAMLTLRRLAVRCARWFCRRCTRNRTASDQTRYPSRYERSNKN